MGDNTEVFIRDEERDPAVLENILRHSFKRNDEPVLLVQLPNAIPSGTEFPLGQRRATIVNMVNDLTQEQKVDPFEWYFNRNSPNLRTSLAREGAADELTSRRKSRASGLQPEQAASRNNVNRFSVLFDVEEDDRVARVPSKAARSLLQPDEDKERVNTAAPVVRLHTKESEANLKLKKLYIDGFLERERKTEDGERETEEGEADGEENMPVIDTIMKSIGKSESNKGDMIEQQDKQSVSDRKPLSIESKRTSVVDLNVQNEMTVMPAQYSFTDHKSPFKKDRDEIRPRPSSRVRVLIMLDELEEFDSLEDDYRRHQGDGRGKGGKGTDRYGKGRKMSGKSISDETRKEYISGESPLKAKDKDKSGRGRRSADDGYDGGKDEGTQRGRKPGRIGDDWDERDKQGTRPGDTNYDKRKYGPGKGYDGGYDDDARGRRGRPVGYDGRKYGDGARPGKGYDDDYDDDGKGRRGKPGDPDYDRRKYGDGGRPGKGYDDGYDGDDRTGSRRRPGDPDYDKRKYGDGSRPGRGYDDGYDDGGKGRRGKPGDPDYDRRKYGDGGKPGRNYDDGYDGDDRTGSRRRPGDPDYDKRKYGDGSRPGKGYDDGYDDGGKSWRGKPGDPEYGRKKYGDGGRPGKGYDDGFDDDGKDRLGKPGDPDYDRRKYGDGGRPGKGYDDGYDDNDRGGRGRPGGKSRPGGDNDGTKYRTVTMPKSATTLTSRRRYHIQITDHNMKEPWFNSCFNISKENNVDFNYDGPVKITPYYVGDKFS